MSDGQSESHEVFEEDLPKWSELAPEVEPPAPKPASVTPRGWTDQEWAAKNYGKPVRRSPWSSLSIGKGWLLAVLLSGVAALLVVLAFELRNSF